LQATVYTTPTCPYCHQVKAYLTQKGVQVRELDVSRDAAAASEMVRISGQRGVPVTQLGGEVIVGFDRPRIDAALAQSQRPRLGAAVAAASRMQAEGRCRVAQGAFVGKVRPGGIAAQAGLRPGDVILSIGGQPVESDVHLQSLIAGVQLGQRLSLRYQRRDQVVETVATF